jgi:signal transduction histidine kinase/CheY-like chemotaxis protein
MSRRRSLQHRIAMLSAWSMLAALVGSGAAFWRLESSSVHQSAVANLETLARMTATNVQASVELGDPETVGRFLDRVVALPEIEAVALQDEHGDLIAGAGRIERIRPADGSAPPDGGIVGRAAMPYRDAAGETRLGMVTVRQSERALARRLSRSLATFAAVAVIGVAALLLVVRPLLRRMFRPVQQLLDATCEVRCTRDYSLRVPVGRDDEIGDLVRSCNAMLEAIQERDVRLAQNAQTLEQVVRERTVALEAALARTEDATRAKSTFLANMSHEIRTPLNAVLGMTGLAMETDDPAEQAEYLRIVQSAGNSLLAVLNDVLDLGKIESGKLEIVRVAAGLESVALEAIRPLTSRLLGKELDVHLVAGPGIDGAHEFDDVRVRQIVTNLVGNAIKFTERGHVLVSLDVRGADGEVDQVEIRVDDTGVGIQPDRLQAIFSPFTQADPTITRRFSGTGLGLTICDHLARLMGGSISVQSQYGSGSTFRVALPMRRLPAMALPPALAGRALFVHTGSQALRASLGHIAQRLGAAVHSVSSDRRELEALLESAARTADALLVLDERDPDVDGLVAARLPVAGDGHRPVLLLTTYQELSAARQRCSGHAYRGYALMPLGTRDFAAQALATAGREPKALPGAVGGRALRVLVAEDNHVNQRLVQKLLERGGHAPTLVADGRSCVEAFRAQPFDLVLMDVQMPEMNGLEAATRIRDHEAGSGRRVPIVALTANATAEDRAACLGAGMDDVLTKPISAARLQATLRRIEPQS